MQKWFRAPSPETWAVHLVAVAVLAELGIREAYHRIAGETFKIGVTICVWFVLCVILALTSNGSRTAGFVRRLAMVAGAALCVRLLLGDAFVAWQEGSDPGGRLGLGAVGALGPIIVCGTLVSLHRFRRWCQVFATLVAIFVFSQPLLVLRAPSLTWPPKAAEEGATKSITLFVLLDEWNGSAAGPLLDLLRDRRIPFQFKSIRSVGDRTARVIPAMFTGMDYSQAKACHSTAICSGSHSLDFSKMTASRRDVDVVGFFHPYCAIHGLRYCARLSPPLGLSFDRLRCSLQQRMHVTLGADRGKCAQLYLDAWSQLTDDVERSIWNAPVWTEGGFLLAHIPLPHPPGRSPGGSLQDDYRENLGTAYRWVAGMIDRVKASPQTKLHLVLFSDHPLRRALWCGKGGVYQAHCASGVLPQEAELPLIVAGDDLPDISSIESNEKIFSLASQFQ